MTPDREPVWFPSEAHLTRSRLARLMRQAGYDDYTAFQRWSVENLDAFWRMTLDDLAIRFDESFERVCDLSDGIAWPRWFVGGQFNFAKAALRWAKEPESAGRVAIDWRSETGSVRRLTYAELASEVELAMARLRALGMRRGDCVGIMLPNVPLAAVLLLAVTGLGAILVPLYSGFGPAPVIQRLKAANAKLLLAQRQFIRAGRSIDLAPVLDEVASTLPDCRLVLADDDSGSVAGWSTIDPVAGVEFVSCDPNDPAMLLFTSGTSGRPKGTVHTHGGFPLRIAQDVAYLFDFEPGDRFFWFSDMGWMIGPMSICGPLLLGGTLVLYDGGPLASGPETLFEVGRVARVTHMGFSPTLVRTLAAQPGFVLSHWPELRILMSAGEVITPEAFDWLFERVGRSRLPIINYTGGTEVSGGLLSNIVLRPISPGTFNAVPPGVDVAVFAETEQAQEGEVGELVIRAPFPGMTKGLWQNPEQYVESYWYKRPGVWSHGDLAVRDGEQWQLFGRADDVIKVSGRRVGPSEIEAAASSVSGVYAVAAIGLPDQLTGEALVVLVVGESDEGLGERVKSSIAASLGKALMPKHVLAVDDLPRTRNAKIVRRLIRDVLADNKIGDVSTIENPAALESIRNAWTCREGIGRP